MNDSVLNSELVLARRNDQNAIRRLTERFSSVIRSIAGSYFIYGGDIDDLYQIGLIGFYDAVKRYDAERNADFARFAKICIHSSIIDAIKEANRKKHSPLNNSLPIDKVNAEGGIDPEKQFIVREQLLSVYSAIDFRLSDYEKRVLNLYIDGLSYAEISQHINKSVKSVSNAVSRIRGKLL